MTNESKTFERLQRGSSLTEYIVVMLAFTVAFLSLPEILDFIREHNDEFSSALQLPF